MANIPVDVQYILLVLALFVGPRLLQRYRIPNGISCLALGLAVGIGLGGFNGDTAIDLLSTLGIVSLFLFAGMEVDLAELKKGAKVIGVFLGVQAALLALATYAAVTIFGLAIRPGVIFGLALTTPSTGFILDSLSSFGLGSDERFWVRSKAISAELLALAVLFVTVQSRDAATFGMSTAALGAMIVLLPPLFRVFGRLIAPHAPNTEFTFLIIVALIYSYATKALGVYYLVGAFLVGVTALGMRKRLPALSDPKLLGAVELFAGFFIPFYFFRAGLRLGTENFTPAAIGIGLAMTVVVVPVRIVATALHRKWALGESFRTGARVSISLIPTFVFTIVLAGILHETYELPAHLVGALIVFTMTNTLIPGFTVRALVDYTNPHSKTDSLHEPEIATAPTLHGQLTMSGAFLLDEQRKNEDRSGTESGAD